ncbi:hypothetical protein [Salinispora pacifica]|uniref:hypothetical protein n=1 Tax=Salinispora pacifica TaxID=351187 RepID=UPI00047FD818|nr:hypothetical protein [Salinispora pacifica]
MELDLDNFVATVDARARQLHNIGIQWQLHRGPTYNKSAAWIDCTNGDLVGWLIVWTSGEAELETADLTTGSVDSTHYEFSALNDLTTCLDDLIRRLTARGRLPEAGTAAGTGRETALAAVRRAWPADA